MAAETSAQASPEAARTPRSAGLTLVPLIGIVVGSMIGGGIFSLPQTIAVDASPAAAIIGWVVTGVGMLMLALVFQTLATRKPGLDAGIYAYARAGFGDFVGHTSAWGYWISAWLGNVSYLVLMFSSLGLFLPAFGQGNTVAAVFCASLLLWSLHVMVLRGVEQAASINALATAAKIVPIALFIVVLAFAFSPKIFLEDPWGLGSPTLGSVGEQVRATMLVTVFVFIGVEGASVYSGRARRRSDVGVATVLGFALVLVLLVGVNVLSYGVMSRTQLATLPNPSMAEVLAAVVGPWGATLIGVGLIISLLGALLSWSLLCAEVLSASAKGGVLPAFLARKNANGVPAAALWLTNILIQGFLAMTLVFSATYTTVLLLATSMILLPYLWTAAYAVKIAVTGDGYEEGSAAGWLDLARGSLALAYAVWLVYAGGLKYLFLSAILYAVGLPFFAKARREAAVPIFKGPEWFFAAAIVIAAALGLIGLSTGRISP